MTFSGYYQLVCDKPSDPERRCHKYWLSKEDMAADKANPMWATEAESAMWGKEANYAANNGLPQPAPVGTAEWRADPKHTIVAKIGVDGSWNIDGPSYVVNTKRAEPGPPGVNLPAMSRRDPGVVPLGIAPLGVAPPVKDAPWVTQAEADVWGKAFQYAQEHGLPDPEPPGLTRPANAPRDEDEVDARDDSVNGATKQAWVRPDYCQVADALFPGQQKSAECSPPVGAKIMIHGEPSEVGAGLMNRQIDGDVNAYADSLGVPLLQHQTDTGMLMPSHHHHTVTGPPVLGYVTITIIVLACLIGAALLAATVSFFCSRTRRARNGLPKKIRRFGAVEDDYEAQHTGECVCDDRTRLMEHCDSRVMILRQGA